MGKPNYMRTNAYSPISIVVRIEKLTNYIFEITNSEKQFPKVMRYTLSAELRKICLSMNKHVYRAMAIKPNSKKNIKLRQKYQQKLYNDIIDFKAMSAVAFSTANVKNIEHFSELFNDVADSFNRWVKNDKRNIKRGYKPSTSPMERDSDGFIILKRKAD